MQPINLNEIIFNKKIIGIVCPNCFGDLVLVKKTTWSQQISKLIFKRMKGGKNYQCKNCEKIFSLK
jgi:hypothetical protein